LTQCPPPPVTLTRAEEGDAEEEDDDTTGSDDDGATLEAVLAHRAKPLRVPQSDPAPPRPLIYANSQIYVLIRVYQVVYSRVQAALELAGVTDEGGEWSPKPPTPAFGQLLNLFQQLSSGAIGELGLACFVGAFVKC
jgi:hypothetical protein